MLILPATPCWSWAELRHLAFFRKGALSITWEPHAARRRRGRHRNITTTSSPVTMSYQQPGYAPQQHQGHVLHQQQAQHPHQPQEQQQHSPPAQRRHTSNHCNTRCLNSSSSGSAMLLTRASSISAPDTRADSIAHRDTNAVLDVMLQPGAVERHKDGAMIQWREAFS